MEKRSGKADNKSRKCVWERERGRKIEFHFNNRLPHEMWYSVHTNATHVSHTSNNNLEQDLAVSGIPSIQSFVWHFCVMLVASPPFPSLDRSLCRLSSALSHCRRLEICLTFERRRGSSVSNHKHQIAFDRDSFSSFSIITNWHIVAQGATKAIIWPLNWRYFCRVRCSGTSHRLNVWIP